MAILVVGMISCEPEFENPIDERTSGSSGSLDFSNYVAIGNSLTAGFADNALYLDGQEAAYPNILAGQMKFLGGGDFTQPLVTSNAGGLTIGGSEITDACTGENSFPVRTVLGLVDGEQSPIAYSAGGAPTEVTTVLSGPFNNMGVAGAKSFHLLFNGYGDPANLSAGLANPYFVRMASSPTTTILEDALSQKPTFFTLWIGNNDALGFATSGGVTTAEDPSCGDDLTDPATFTQAYGAVVQSLLTTTEAKGVLINLPSVTTIPFFTTVPYTPLDPRDENFGPLIPALNSQFAAFNAIVSGAGMPERAITFSTTMASAVIIKDDSLTDISSILTEQLVLGGLDMGTATVFGLQYGQARPATENDLLLLTSSSIIGQVNTDRITQLMGLGVPEDTAGQLAVNGVTFPLESKWVLTSDEQQEIADAQSAFNATIEGLVTANSDRLALYDAKSQLEEVATGGIEIDGGVVTSAYATGGGFSLDGVHLTPRGNALIANGLMEVIKRVFAVDIPTVQPGTYKTITVQ